VVGCVVVVWPGGAAGSSLVQAAIAAPTSVMALNFMN
jgi:hypothetical protein